MKSILLFFVVLSITGYCKSQNTKMIGDTLVVNDSIKIYEGMDLQLGMGSNASTKEFNFIYLGPNILTSPSQKEGLGSSYSGTKIRVKKIKNYGNKKRGDKFILVCGGGNIVNYWCEIENAIKSGEVVFSR